ncbi:MAG: hypothetical protein KA371_09115 [Acidobacteria bacterium]|nr:hypothetical protein [Acidobacteriota bacterium]
MARIVLVDRAPDEKAPALVIHITDAALKPLATLKVDDKGSVDLKEDALKEAAYVAIASADEKVEALSRDNVVLLRARHVAEMLRGTATIELARGRWERLWPLRRCVSGKVRACRWPFLVSDLLAPNLPARAAIRAAAAETVAGRTADLALAPGLGTELLFPRRCYAVCEGVVEVYLRRCCWRPIVVFDPRIDEIIRELERIPFPIPDPDPGPIGPDPIGPDPFGPRPGPDPAPFLRGGVPDELTLNARRDLVALRTLSPLDQAAYIEARPYFRRLFHCGTPHLVGSGFLQPDGEFQVCWRSFPFIPPFNCFDQVAYVVKQLINGVTVTIYDGRAAGQWFGLGETPTLTTYDRRAITCRGGDTPPVPGAAVFLELIGTTESHNLESPAPAGWDRVSGPDFNSGLLFPASTLAAAKGVLRNCNLGGTLNLLYRFSEPLRGAGAKYYRLTVSAADGAGNPVGTPRRISPPSTQWRKFRFAGGGIQVIAVPLAAGPVASGETDLWTIPYDLDLPSNEEWLANQFHGQIDSTEFGNGRHVLTVEVFNAAGQRLRPTGAAGPGTDAPFLYHLWEQSGGIDSFPTVPFSGLTHMLWWDNRAGTGDIEGVQVAGSPIPVGTCLFLSGPGTALLHVRHRAYHPEEMFLHRYALTAYRGLEGPVHNPPAISNGNLPVADAAANAGMPPAAAALSTGVSFATLLGTHVKCSFAVNLTMSLKTTNGAGFLHQGGLRDTVAFALEIV